MDVRGPFDLESNELLVWEIEKLQGLRFSHRGDIFFHHPALKLPVRGENTDCVSVPSGAKELEVDADEEPTAAKEQRLIHQPVEGVTFDAQLRTKIAYKIAYNGERANGHGKKVDDEQCPSRESQLFGVADPVSEGSIASGEFQQLGEGEGDGDEHERLADRFSLLREILEQITQESGVALVALEVRPQPPVPRCSYLMIEHEKSRCYLLARFKLQNGDQRYLLEIDTSDNRKTMSTRIMGFKAGVKAGKCIDRILRETVKSSLRWPGTMAKYCEPLHSVHHPKESSSGANHARVFDWKQRIRAALG